jgi:hypothetical protein
MEQHPSVATCQVLEVAGDRLSRAVKFNDPALVTTAGLPDRP